MKKTFSKNGVGNCYLKRIVWLIILAGFSLYFTQDVCCPK